MKIFVRALVIALALTGAAATIPANASGSAAQPSFSKANAMPIPSCDPSDPNSCGMGTGQ